MYLFTASNSIGTGTPGELRFYGPDRSDVNLPLGINLNGTSLPFSSPVLPNEQGAFLFGNGPYSGAFSFYFAHVPTVVAPTVAVTPTPSTPPSPPPTLPPLDITGSFLTQSVVGALSQIGGDTEFSDPFTVENQFTISNQVQSIASAVQQFQGIGGASGNPNSGGGDVGGADFPPQLRTRHLGVESNSIQKVDL